MMPRPTLKDTSDWEVAYESETVKLERGTLKTRDGFTHVHGAYRVTIKEHLDPMRRGPDGGRVLVAKKHRLFYGESAWSDAERMAGDVDFNAWGRS